MLTSFSFLSNAVKSAHLDESSLLKWSRYTDCTVFHGIGNGGESGARRVYTGFCKVFFCLSVERRD